MFKPLHQASLDLPWTVPGHGYETALCACYAAILTPVAAPVSRAFCSSLT